MQNSACHIRNLNHASAAEIELVARRMRATLEEVLGPERGGTMYTMAWLIERVQQHIHGDLQGEVLLAEERTGQIIGHTIVRVARGRNGDVIGLFSTIYTPPQHRLTFSLVCKMLISGAAQYTSCAHTAGKPLPRS